MCVVSVSGAARRTVPAASTVRAVALARSRAIASSTLSASPSIDWPSDRKSVVVGKSVSVRVDLGGRRILKKKNIKHEVRQYSHCRSQLYNYKNQYDITNNYHCKS